MISLIIVITFFFILIVFYPTVSFVLSISGCLLKRFAGELIYKNEKIGEIVEKKTDELKNFVFIISVFLVFFFVTPLTVFYMIGVGAIKAISW